MNIYLDIETIPSQRDDVRTLYAEWVKVPANYKDPEKIAAYIEEHAEEEYRKTALDGGYGEICCIGWAVDDEPSQYLYRTDAEDDERDVLAQWFAHMKGTIDMRPNQKPTLVGHNLGFDLRFLHHRSVVLRVKPPFWIPYNAAAWQGHYIDTMYEWCGARGSVKLTTLCDMLGIEVEDNIDGSQVWDAFQRGDITAIAEHCDADVNRVREIHRRLMYRS